MNVVMEAISSSVQRTSYLRFIKLRRTCSITSGAIQHGVPTKVCLVRSLDRSPLVATKELTPKSASWMVPSSPSSTLPAFTSLRWEYKKSNGERTNADCRKMIPRDIYEALSFACRLKITVAYNISHSRTDIFITTPSYRRYFFPGKHNFHASVP